ncbi:MAG: CpsB/CapC family capsule biosynthesis tyrosine phosphatase [Azonexus sp.]|jgi:protein-tyrosine phosphatase|nr:CpsB/CapC family capsule biosynthesis tyrosine phosphatase [Azonexus sp.]
MIDLHTHFLPGVDDGAQTLADALSLAKAAVADGIHTAVLTPHVHPGRYDNELKSLSVRFAAFRDALRDAAIPLDIRLGAEVRLSVESLELLLDERIPFIGRVDGYKVMLLEFPHQSIPVGSERFVDKLLALGVRPLIAHPERNKTVMLDPMRLTPFLDAGCWLQLTAGSVAGHFGKAAQETASFILQHNWAQVIATDAHNLEHRPPVLKAGYLAAAAIVGEAQAKAMVLDFPARILGVS